MSRFTELREELEALARDIILGDLREELGKELVNSEIAPNIEVEAAFIVRFHDDGMEHEKGLGEGREISIFGLPSKAYGGLHFTSKKADRKPDGRDYILVGSFLGHWDIKDCSVSDIYYDSLRRAGRQKGAYDCKLIKTKTPQEMYALAKAYAEREGNSGDARDFDARIYGYIQGYESGRGND